MIDCEYEKAPQITLSPEYGGHYWNVTPHNAGKARRSAAASAARTGRVQRIHYHSASEPCRSEVHEDVAA